MWMGFTVPCWQFRIHQSPDNIFLSWFLRFSGDQLQDVHTATWLGKLSTRDSFLSSREWIALASAIHPVIIVFSRVWDVSTSLFPPHKSAFTAGILIHTSAWFFNNLQCVAWAKWIHQQGPLVCEVYAKFKAFWSFSACFVHIAQGINGSGMHVNKSDTLHVVWDNLRGILNNITVLATKGFSPKNSQNPSTCFHEKGVHTCKHMHRRIHYKNKQKKQKLKAVLPWKPQEQSKESENVVSLFLFLPSLCAQFCGCFFPLLCMLHL